MRNFGRALDDLAMQIGCLFVTIDHAADKAILVGSLAEGLIRDE